MERWRDGTEGGKATPTTTRHRMLGTERRRDRVAARPRDGADGGRATLSTSWHRMPGTERRCDGGDGVMERWCDVGR
jgi:hypothetical protein